MNYTPLVTVLCSCYNHQNFVCESIQSIINQSYKNIQIIVIDDFSTDNSNEVIKEFIQKNPQILYIKNKTNLGLTKSISNAMNFVEGKYFIDLAADDVLLPNCIKSQVNAFQNSKFNKLAMVYGNVELITEFGTHSKYYFSVDKFKKTKHKIPSGDIYKHIIDMNTTICSVSALYSKSVFDELNGYDTTLSYEDLDYWIRASRNYNIEFIDEVLMQKRIIPNSLQSTLHTLKNKNSNCTYKILKKAYLLNKNKNENKALSTRVNFEILNAYRNENYILMLKNLFLRFKIWQKTKL